MEGGGSDGLPSDSEMNQTKQTGRGRLGSWVFSILYGIYYLPMHMHIATLDFSVRFAPSRHQRQFGREVTYKQTARPAHWDQGAARHRAISI